MNNKMTNETEKKNITIYTDGASIRNPGRSGWASIIICDDKRTEILGGFRKSTNNRMEILAAIEALESLDSPAVVTIFSDAEYLTKAFTDNWLDKWQQQGWKTSSKKPVLNKDLWLRLLAACEPHTVKFQWVRGHSGITDNERADTLANLAAEQDDLDIDVEYERTAKPAALKSWRRRLALNRALCTFN